MEGGHIAILPYSHSTEAKLAFGSAWRDRASLPRPEPSLGKFGIMAERESQRSNPVTLHLNEQKFRWVLALWTSMQAAGSVQ